MTLSRSYPGLSSCCKMSWYICLLGNLSYRNSGHFTFYKVTLYTDRSLFRAELHNTENEYFRKSSLFSSTWHTWTVGTLFPAILKQGGILPNIIVNQLWFLARASALHYILILIYFNLGDDKGEPPHSWGAFSNSKFLWWHKPCSLWVVPHKWF